MTTVLAAPSLLSCDFAKLGEEVRACEAAGADWLHLDVMDGHFVPNLSFGVPVVEAIGRVATKPLDVHLMIQQPTRYAEAFAKAGATVLSFHLETIGTTDDAATVEAAIEDIRNLGLQVGLAISPDTPAEALVPYLERIDLALVMTVHPGFGGQALLPHCLEKVRALRREANGRGLDGLRIEVDGGINATTVGDAIAAGADVIVAGSYVFRASDYAVPIGKIRSAAANTVKTARRS